MRSTLVRSLIGLAIGALFIWLSARDWPMDKLLGQVTLNDGYLMVAPNGLSPANVETLLGSGEGWAVKLWWLIPYLGILTVIHFLRVIRWIPLVDPIVKLDFWTHNRIGAVGFMAMFLFPLRLGELVRPYLVKKATQGTRMTHVLATVVVERVVDGLVVSLILFAVLSGLPASDPDVANNLQLGALFALSVFAVASALLVGMVWQRDRTVSLIRRTIGVLSTSIATKVTDLLEAFLEGLRQLPSARSFLWFLWLTCVYWVINGLGVWCMVQAFALPVDLIGSYAMMACVVVGMMIPNSPGNVGSFWYFLLIPAALYPVAPGSTQAIAFGLGVWLAQLIQQTAFGAWFMIRGQVSYRRIVEATRESDITLRSDSATIAPLTGS